MADDTRIDDPENGPEKDPKAESDGAAETEAPAHAPAESAGVEREARGDRDAQPPADRAPGEDGAAVVETESTISEPEPASLATLDAGQAAEGDVAPPAEDDRSDRPSPQEEPAEDSAPQPTVADEPVVAARESAEDDLPAPPADEADPDGNLTKRAEAVADPSDVAAAAASAGDADAAEVDEPPPQASVADVALEARDEPSALHAAADHVQADETATGDTATAPDAEIAAAVAIDDGPAASDEPQIEEPSETRTPEFHTPESDERGDDPSPDEAHVEALPERPEPAREPERDVDEAPPPQVSFDVTVETEPKIAGDPGGEPEATPDSESETAANHPVADAPPLEPAHAIARAPREEGVATDEHSARAEVEASREEPESATQRPELFGPVSVPLPEELIWSRATPDEPHDDPHKAPQPPPERNDAPAAPQANVGPAAAAAAQTGTAVALWQSGHELARREEAVPVAAAARSAEPRAPSWPTVPLPSRAHWDTARRYLRLALRTVAIAIVGYAMLVVILTALYRWVNPPTSNLMLAQQLTGTEIRQRWVPLGRISPHLVQAVILSEDGAFCRHSGVDWLAMEEAIESSLEGVTRGGSTITMQVVKNLFLWSSRSYVRKAIEITLAHFVELFWPKPRVLEIYLNIAEWGDGVFGAEAAARHHFRKPASQLTAQEAALLAVALPNPIERQAGRPGALTRRLASNLLVRMKSVRTPMNCVRAGRSAG